MPFSGYKVYRGVGGLGSVDFSSDVGSVVSGNDSIDLVGLGYAVSTRYAYVLRAVVDDLETPDLSCAVEFVTDGSGDWLGNRPAIPSGLTATVKDGGDVELRWTYRTPWGGAAPADFGIYYGTDPQITTGSPQTTKAYAAPGRYAKTITLSDGVTYWFGITARTAGGVESPLSGVVGPVVADDTAPSAPTLLASASS